MTGLPPILDRLSQERQDFIISKEEELSRRAARVQARVFEEVKEILIKSFQKGDRYKVLSDLARGERQIYQKYTRPFYTTLARELNQQFGTVQTYFQKLLGKESKRAESRAKKAMLNRIGYDGRKMVNGGLFAEFAKDLSNLKDVKTAAVRAVSSGQSITSFIKQLRTSFIGDDGKLGVLESKVRTALLDVYQQNDRIVVKNIADDVGIKHYIYQGGLMTTSRPFCVARNNRAYTSQEIESWRNIDFQGKSTPYDPFIDAGGYNCRHTLDPISEELYDEIKGEENQPEEETDVLNEKQIAAHQKKLEPYIANMDEEFLSIMSPDTKISMLTGDRTNHYNPNTDKVVLHKKYRQRASKYYRENVAYHEIGHSIHTTKELLNHRYIDPDLRKSIDSMINKHSSELKGLSDRLNKMVSRISGFKRDTIESRGITLNDVWESEGVVQDVIGSMTNGKYGGGHSVSYYRNHNGSYKEIMAHASSLKYIPNRFFDKYAPELRDDLINLIDKYYFGK